MSRAAGDRHGGFTLVEVMVASVVLLAGIAGAAFGVANSESQRNRAMARQEATMILRSAIQRLMPLTTSICPGSPGDPVDLLADVSSEADPSWELMCFGGGLGGALGDCTPDYPRVAMGTGDLDTLLGASAGLDSVYRIAAAAPLPEVSLGRRQYRVAWNVVCDSPVVGNKVVNVIVGWAPFATAVAEFRYESAMIVKGQGF